MPGEQTAEGARASDVVVCHACIGDSPAPPCQWMPPLSDFPLMTAAQTLRWKPVVKLREVQRAELVWRDLSAEALGEAAGADGRCVQCRKYYTPAAADGGYCSACWVSSCCICGCWDQRLVGAKVPERWQCLACLRLPPKNQEYFRVMAAALEASFVPWHTSWRHNTLEEIRAAKAAMPVPQPAKVADWLYLGDIHDLLLVAESRLPVGVAGVLSLCPECVRQVDWADRFWHLRDVGCAHQVVAASDSVGFDMISEALPAAIHFARPFFERRVPVLVHSHRGINRAVFVAVALLMVLDHMRLTDALRAVAASRGAVLTNRSFRGQLLDIASRTGRLQ